MKTKLLTTNIGIAAIAVFSRLIAILFCSLFFEQHGIRLSIIALAISCWGFLSLKQPDTQQETQCVDETSPVFHKPQYRKNKRKLITAVVLVLMSGVMLSGAIKTIDATQNVLPCTQETGVDCVKVIQQSTYPKLPLPGNSTLRRRNK